MTTQERILELEIKISELKKNKKCNNCDRNELIYQLNNEIKRLKNKS